MGSRKMKRFSDFDKNGLNVALIYGGKSCEHDISVITACLAKGYFRGNLYSIYIDKQNRPFLVGNDITPRAHLESSFKNKVIFLLGEGAIGIYSGRRLVRRKIDVAVNCCHGMCGEDGCVAALCQMCGIPLVGSDLASSAIAMDKILTKRLLQSYGFPVVKGEEVTKNDCEGFIRDSLSFPVIVKPSKLGSSIGVKVAHSSEQLKEVLELAFRYCPRVLVEQALVDFVELNCAAMRVEGNVQTSSVDCPVTVNELLTFADKYENGAVGDSPVVEQETQLRVQKLTAEIYEKLGFGGVIRVDYLLSKTGELFVNEINTTPGSLAFGLWEYGYSRTRYGEVLTAQAIADYRELQNFTYTFESSVLKGSGGIKKK